MAEDGPSIEPSAVPDSVLGMAFKSEWGRASPSPSMTGVVGKDEALDQSASKGEVPVSAVGLMVPEVVTGMPRFCGSKDEAMSSPVAGKLLFLSTWP